MHGQVIALGDLKLTLVHPASQVSNVLAGAGETTMTTTTSQTVTAAAPMSLLLPLLGVVLFGGLVVAMLML